MKIKTSRATSCGRAFAKTVLAVLALQLLLTFSAHAATLTVCASGCDYTLIGLAENAAADGDTIRVMDALHSEPHFAIVRRNITIEGRDDDATHTTIQSIAEDTLITAVTPMATLRNLTVTGGHSTLYGGALLIANGYSVVVDHCIFSNNTAGFTGGAIDNEGTLTVNNSTFSGNSAGGLVEDSGFNAAGAGGAIYADGALEINNSTFSGNTVLEGTDPNLPPTDSGGAIAAYRELTIRNSTIVNNTGRNAGGIYASHYEPLGPTSISNSTIAGNTGYGLELHLQTMIAKNTIIASGSGDACHFDQVTEPDSAGNLATDATCGSGVTQVTPAQLNLGSLATNAPGSTATIALLPNSVAINAASNCLDALGAILPSDQRGVARPQGGACDVGAYEVIPLASSVVVSTPNATSLAGTALTFTALVTGAGTPGGTMDFCADGAVSDISFCQTGSVLCSAVILASGSATCITDALLGGSHIITASYSGDGSNLPAQAAAITQQVTFIGQIITGFAPVSPVIFGDAAQVLNATGGGGSSAVIFSVISGPCAISGSSLSYSGAGTCIIAADQAGDATHSAAPQVTAAVIVNQASQTVSFGTPPVIAVGGSGSVTATTTATPPVNYPIVLSTTSSDCSVTAAGLVTGITAGSNNCVIVASQAGDMNFRAASATQTLSIGLTGSAVTLTSSANPSTQNDAVTFVATVTAGAQPAHMTNALATPTGSIVFSDNGTPLATVALDNSGSASYITSTLSAGSHTITAAYSGDTDIQASTGMLTQTVNAIVIAPPVVQVPLLSNGWLAVLGGLLAVAGFAKTNAAGRREPGRLHGFFNDI